MKLEDLIKSLSEQGVEEAQIEEILKGLFDELKAKFEQPEAEPQEEAEEVVEESEEEKRKRIFGI